MSDKELIEKLQQTARILRHHIVRMMGVGQKGHLGGSCSIADIVAVLYFHHIKLDPQNPKWEGRDRFLLSKGHAALAQYAALAELGFFPADEMDGVKTLGSNLQGHPDLRKTPGIEANTGSLGQGLSIACGMAAALRINCSSSRVYCVVGDGELDEGQIWEAAMSAAFYKLDTLTVILDKNRLMSTGFIEERFNSNPLPEKWLSFGWWVTEIDGHDIVQILDALDRAEAIKGQPRLIIAHTVKGKGVSFAEDNPSFHNSALTEAQYQQALQELEGGAR
jgi:transketolase